MEQSSTSVLGASAPRLGVTAAARSQRWLTLAVVLLPTAGVLAAGYLAANGHPPTAVDGGLFLFFFAVTTLGVELGFHRYFSHVAFKAKPLVRFGLAVAGSMAAQGPPIFWAAIHRRHHAFSDRPGDPHSPYVSGDRPLSLWAGLWHAHIGWLFVQDVPDWGRYAPDLARDRRLISINQNYLLYVLLGLALPAAVGGALAGNAMGALTGCLWGGFVRVFALHHMTWAINSLCHVLGDRPFRARDKSTNNVWLMLPSMGGAWHNTHHAFPSLAKNNVHWWQLDLCGCFLTLLEWTKLAWDANVPTARMKEAAGRHRSNPSTTPGATDDRG